MIEDDVLGFAHECTLTNPAGTSKTFKVLTSDIGALIDPDTGDMVSGRYAEVVFRLKTLADESFNIPRNIREKDSKPWVVTFNDVNGVPGTFKIIRSEPDKEAGMITCVITVYKPLTP
jgi:hypothetical protein